LLVTRLLLARARAAQRLGHVGERAEPPEEGDEEPPPPPPPRVNRCSAAAGRDAGAAAAAVGRRAMIPGYNNGWCTRQSPHTPLILAFFFL
jgi:hypothetical protein